MDYSHFVVVCSAFKCCYCWRHFECQKYKRTPNYPAFVHLNALLVHRVPRPPYCSAVVYLSRLFGVHKYSRCIVYAICHIVSSSHCMFIFIIIFSEKFRSRAHFKCDLVGSVVSRHIVSSSCSFCFIFPFNCRAASISIKRACVRFRQMRVNIRIITWVHSRRKQFLNDRHRSRPSL